MLKVCYIITKLELGGAQKFTLYTAENINKEHFEVSLICGINGILDEEAKKNIRTLFLPDLVREISPVKDLKALFKIWKILRKEKPDIV
ncbi:MAG: hypothetical protein LBL00_07460, partial [Endomicrobium sp.]|nr:hypothetical protein [Endomicrobium sp.]